MEQYYFAERYDPNPSVERVQAVIRVLQPSASSPIVVQRWNLFNLTYESQCFETSEELRSAQDVGGSLYHDAEQWYFASKRYVNEWCNKYPKFKHFMQFGSI
jgi:hypothetical protein